MAKPSTEPRWVGSVATPSTPKQTAGFASGERPAARYLNWFMNLVWQWVVYLKNFGDHDQVFTAEVTFNGVTTLNDILYVDDWTKVQWENRLINLPLAPCYLSANAAFSATNFRIGFSGTTPEEIAIVPVPRPTNGPMTVYEISFDLLGGLGVNLTILSVALIKKPVGGGAIVVLDTEAFATTTSTVRRTASMAASIDADDDLYVRFKAEKASTTTLASVANVTLMCSNS